MYKRNKTLAMIMRQPKLMTRRKVLMGDLTMKTIMEWRLHRRMSYVICKTLQGFLPAGFYLIVSPPRRSSAR